MVSVVTAANVPEFPLILESLEQLNMKMMIADNKIEFFITELFNCKNNSKFSKAITGEMERFDSSIPNE